MKFDFKTILILTLTVVIICLIIFWPPKSYDGKIKYENTIDSLKGKLTTVQTAQDTQIKLARQIKVKDSVVIKAMDSKIRLLQNKAVGQKLVVQTIIENNPDLESFIATQQEIIHEFQVEVDTLKSQLAFRDRIYADLISNEYIEDKIEGQMQLEASIRIADLEKTIKKSRRVKKFLRVGIVVLPVTALLLGSQL